MLGLSSFRSQLLLLIIGLFTLVLAAVFFSVDKANKDNARLHIDEALGISSFAFQRDLASRNEVLVDKARLLSSDFAFKEAVATNDKSTIFSALDNHRIRVDADVMMLAELDGSHLISTMHGNTKDDEKWTLEVLQEAAENDDNGEANGIQLLEGKPYQLVIMPLFTPEPSAWIVIGFRIRNSFSEQLSKQTNTQVSLLYQKNTTRIEDQTKTLKKDAAKDEIKSSKKMGGVPIWQLLSSTFDTSKQKALLTSMEHLQNEVNKNIKTNQTADFVDSIYLNDDEYLSKIINVKGSGEGQTIAVLQRSLDKALEPYLRLNNFMLALFALGLLAAVVGIFYIVRNLSHPIESLTKTVKLIEKGEYQSLNLSSERKDELGILTKAVDRMSQGLQERDQVRNLLGKVVSPEIATELLSKEIKLSGERKLATILFGDVREFTRLCEESDPEEVLLLLNRYFSSMTDSIDKHHGVIDKFIGDALMALFNVPIELDNAPEKAVKAAQEMIISLETLNTKLTEEKIPNIKIGIGINTAEVIAGNMGSLHRSNYSVIGDGVNLASRLERLTKYFGVSIIVSELTMKSCKNIEFCELAKVKIKGKKRSTRIFKPLFANDLIEGNKEILKQFQTARDYFGQQKWQQSSELFQSLLEQNSKLKSTNGNVMFQLYIDNIEILSQQELSKSWLGELVFTHK